MAQCGDREPSMSVLGRLLANAALRDEAGRLRSPEPGAHPPSGGLLGWAQKDLQSEFGIAVEPHRSSFSPSSWSEDTSQGYGLGGTNPRGDSGPGRSDWTSKYGQGAGEGNPREWASRPGIGSGDKSEASALGGPPVQARVIGKPGQYQEAEKQDWEFRESASQGTYSSRDAELQDQEFGKRDSLGPYSSRDASLQDQEFGKRDSLGFYSSQDASLQDQEFGKRDSLSAYSRQDASLRDWEFGKRDSLGAFVSQDAGEQGQELGKEDPLGRFSSRDADEQDREFEKRAPPLGTSGSQEAERQGQGFGKSAWVSDYKNSSSGSTATFGSQDRGFGTRGLGARFGPEEAQQQDDEFEKKIPSGEASLGEASRDGGRPEGREPGGLLSPSTPQPPDGVLGQREQNNWQGSDASQKGGGLLGRWQEGTPSPGSTDLGDREMGERGWAGDFSLHVAPQTEARFSLGQRDWSSDFCIDDSERSHEFGIIGDDRASGAGPSPSGKMGGGHLGPPGKTTEDWADPLGLRNLEVSSCVGSREAREGAVGQMGWSGNLGLADMGLPSHLETGGTEESRGIGAGEKNWTSDVGVRSRDLVGAGEVGDHNQARESGVGQTDWSAGQAREFLKSRERGVGQADWTPDLGLRNVAPGLGCSPGELRELGVGHVDWGTDSGLRSLEVPCDLESSDSLEPRGCGVGQMDWAQDLGVQNVELSGDLGETREHGVGEASQCPQLGVRSNGGLPTSPEARDPSEARELGVGETSGPETQDEEGASPSLETRPEDLGMETGEAPSFVSSPSGCPAFPTPPGSQGLLEEMLAASHSKAAARREPVVLGLSEEEGPMAGSAQGELLEPGRDPPPSWRPQPDGEASQTEEVDGSWGHAGAGRGEQRLTRTPRRSSQGPPPSTPSQDFSFIEDTEILDSAVYRSRANLGRKRGHRAPAIRPGGTLGLSDAADSDARLFQDSTEPRASRVPSSDEEVVEEPQSRRTRMSLGTKGLKVNLFPGLSPSALKAKLRSRNRSAEEGEPVESKSTQKEAVVQRSKSCKVPGLGKPLTLPPKPEKSSGSEGSSPNWLQALKLKKKKV